MDPTLKDLVDLLINAVPTIIFFILLTFYLKYVFFKPLRRILDERKAATEGVRELAERAFEQADRKTSEFERALHEARLELQKEHEILRQQWQSEQLEQITKARAEAEHQIEAARAEISREVERAQSELDQNIQTMADQIVRSLLRRRAA